MDKRSLLEVVEVYANIPSGSGNEKIIQPYIEEQMRNHVDEMWRDKAGNMYFFRSGERDGRVLLCAHQDKVVDSNFEIKLGKMDEQGFKIAKSNKRLGSLLDLLHDCSLQQGHFWTGNSLISARLEIENSVQVRELERKAVGTLSTCKKEVVLLGQENIRKVPSYDLLSEQIKELDHSLANGIFFIPSTPIGLKPKMNLRCWPKFTLHRDGKVEGKLDDSLGLGIITYLNQSLPRENSPDLFTVYTVEEEVGCIGAQNSIAQIKKMDKLPSRVLVVDTTAFAKPGDGPTIYKSCGLVGFDKRYVGDLETTARLAGIGYKSVDPITINDSAVLAKGLENVATVAVEIPIIGMHSALETTTKSDILQTYSLLEKYLTSGSVTPLKGVVHPEVSLSND